MNVQMSHDELRRIGEILLEEGALTHEEVVHLVEEAGLKGTALAALFEQSHHVHRSDLAAFLATEFVVPRIRDLRQFDLYEEAAASVTEELARKHEIVPLARMGDVLCVARPTYFNKAGILELRRATGLRVKVFQADEEQVLAALDRIYGKRAVEIPPPKGDVVSVRETPPQVHEEVLEGVPLIAMPEEAALLPGALAAVRVDRAEFQKEERGIGLRWVREFEETFLKNQPMDAIRVV